MKYGDSLKRLTQLIASYNWSKPKLGPVVAKHIKELFDDAVYQTIREKTPELAFQISVLDSNLLGCTKDLAKEKVYIKRMKSYGQFAVFAVAIRAMHDADAEFGDAAFTDRLLAQWEEWYPTHYHAWKKLTKSCIDAIVKAFKKEVPRHSREFGDELTYANYFKNQGYVSRLLQSPLPPETIRHAKAALNS